MDHYSTLGVPRNATPEQIKKAYRKLAMEHHPDRGGDSSTFQNISVAYDILSDPTKKAQYDTPAQQNPFQGFSVNGFNLNDLFGQHFGQPNQHHRNNQQSFRTRVTVTLMDAYTCSDQVLKLNTPQGLKVINVKIPMGTQTGDQVKYDNVIANASLIVEFVILPDLKFDRRDDDLYSNLPVSVLDLITGTKIQVTTISGKTLEVTIKSKTQPYMQLKIPGEGMLTRNGQFGDQILLLKPYIPDIIDDDIIEVINRTQQNK